MTSRLPRLVGKELSEMEFQTEALGVASILGELRDQGWRVVCHNDYMQDGKLFTFWSFAYGVWYAKGEGQTDYEALRRARQEIARLIAERGN